MGIVALGRAWIINVWEQKKLEARKLLEKPQNPQRPVHALLARICSLALLSFILLT